jgi:hypothetical protein
MNSNYFFSTWIANLGVVPLFSLAFFLTLPVALVLFFLMILVCFVLEPILYSLINYNNKFFRFKYVSFIVTLVKALTIYCALQNQTFAKTYEDIFLAKGEQYELGAKSLKSFSVGNKEVLKYKFRPGKKTILIRGKSMGFSDLVVWNKDNSKTQYHFYVTSKKEQLKKMEVISSLKKTHLSVLSSGSLTHITGTVKTFSGYFSIKYIQSHKDKNIIIDVELDLLLRNEIYSEIYQELLLQGAGHISCKTLSIDISCSYQSSSVLYSLKHFSEKYKINFLNIEAEKNLKNFDLDFIIVVLESGNQLNKSSGFDKIETDLASVIREGNGQLNSESIFLKEQNIKAKIIARPRIRSTLDNHFNIKLGSEIPFKSQKKDELFTEWKFSGLKISGKLNLQHGKLAITYHSELSTPVQDSISGPSGKSTIMVSLDKAIPLFSIKMDSDKNFEQGIPLLKEIPFLKNLFQTSQASTQNKTVLCFLTVKQKGK